MGLEDIVKKAWKTAYNCFHTAVAAATTYISYALVGIDGIITGLAFSAGTYILNLFKKVKTKYIDIIKEYSIGVIAGTVGSKLYGAAEYIKNYDLKGKILRGVGFGIGVATPVFTGAYVGADHIIKNNFNPKGIVKKFKTDYWPILKEVTKWLGVGVALTINGYLGGYPGIVVMDAGYRVVAGLAKK